MIDVIIAGGGKALRMEGINKLTYKIDKVTDFTVLEASLFPFVINSRVDNIYLTYSDITFDEVTRLKNKYSKITLVKGGNSRSQTIKNALSIANGDIVLIHDGARPFVTNNLIDKIIDSTINFDSGIPYSDSTDSLYDISTNSYTNRSNIKRIQTPQGFKEDLLKQAIDKADFDFTDEGTIFNKYIKPITLVEGDNKNIKITTKNDLDTDTYVGVGYDVHRLVTNRKLVLGGIEIENNLGLLGHSDADVLTHSIMDCILGAAGLRDIGYYFPDTDSKYLDISSLILLEKVRDMIYKQGFRIVNINAEIMAEKPKLKPIIPSMIKMLANTLKIDSSKITISATTTEKLGIVGEQKGIACYSICSLEKL